MNRWAAKTRLLSSRGFTLIELMITVAVVAILSAIAYPSYVAYIQRGRVAEVTGLLATTRVRLEQFYQDNRTYGSTATTCGVAMPTAQQFAFTCNWGSGGTNQTFLLTAAGVAGSAMAGFQFTVNDANLQRTVAYPGDTAVPANCWKQRKGQSC
jgi:type IV pilus assembly protein PilE